MTSFVSITDLMRSHAEPYMRLSWFLYEAIEREHRLNLEALSGTPVAFVHAWAWIVASSAGPAGVAGCLGPLDQPRVRRHRWRCP
jgi:hypothetical protein